MTSAALFSRPRRWLPGSIRPCLAGGFLALGLAACGGGAENGGPGADSGPMTRADTETAPPVNPISDPIRNPASPSANGASGAPPAWLTAQSLEAAEQSAQTADAQATPRSLESLPPGAIAPKRAYDNGDVARKAAAVGMPVYRFYNTQTTAHFYTTNESEKANIQATMPHFSFDGPAFEAASEFAPGLSPVYRFYNTQTGVHFYTISESEKNNVLATMPQFHLEGVAYHASQVAGRGLTPLYRFYLPAKGYHFYTASATERDSIRTNLSATYTYEDVGYYVPSGGWNADKLPHTGLTAAQCYGWTIFAPANGTFGTCAVNTFSGTQAEEQDASRTDHNPMSYSRVRFGFLDVTYTVDTCVRDNVTGLVWEGKTDDGGIRDKDNTYTNLGGGAATDASGHVAAVNTSKLCGFEDWRLPTMLELTSLMDYGHTGAAPHIDSTWFPNVGTTAQHWTSQTYGASSAWVASFTERWDGTQSKSTPNHVRLVRGSMGDVSGGRYSYSTLAYEGDAANNVVNDHLTGLQWRRCVEGQVWNGSACTGTSSTFTHRQALTHANDTTRRSAGWRLPNVKEGMSLVVKGTTSPMIDTTAFPNVGLGSSIWTSTAATLNDPLNTAHIISMNNGWLDRAARSIPQQLRLVR